MADYETKNTSNSKKKKRKQKVCEGEEEEQQQHRKHSKSSRVDEELDRAEAKQDPTSLKLEDDSPWRNLQLILALQNKDIHLQTKLELAFAYVQSRIGKEIEDTSQGVEMVSISRVIIFLNNWVQSLFIASEKKIMAEANKQQLEISGSCFDYRCWVIFKFCLEESVKLDISLSFPRYFLRVIYCIVSEQFCHLNGDGLHAKQSISSGEEMENLSKIASLCVSLVFSSHGGVSNENLDLWIWLINTVLELVLKIFHDDICCSNLGVILLELSSCLLEAFAKFLRVHPARKNGFHDFVDKLLVPILHLLDIFHCSVSHLGLRRNLLKLIEEVVSQGIFHPTHIDGFLGLRSTSKYRSSEDTKSKEASVVLKSYHKHLFDKLCKIISEKNMLALGGIGELFRLFLNCTKRQKGVMVNRDKLGLLDRGSATNTMESTSRCSNFVSQNSHYSSGISAELRQSMFNFFVHIMEFFASEIDTYLQMELRGRPILVDIHCLLRSINCLLACFKHEKVYSRVEDISEGASISFLKVIYAKIISLSTRINKLWLLSFGSGERKLWEVLLLIAKELIVAVHYLLDTEYEVVGDDLESLWAVLLSYTACSHFLMDFPSQSLLTSEILRLGCRVINLYSELRQVSISIFALCKALRRLVSPQHINEACIRSYSCGSFTNAMSMFLCSMEFRLSICNAIKSIPEGQATGCIRQLTEDVIESLEWVKLKCQIATVGGCVNSAVSLCFNLELELLGRGLLEVYTLILGSMTVTSGNSNLIGISMKDLMEALRPHLSLLVSQQPEGINQFLSAVTGKSFNEESEYGNTHWILVFFFRLYLSCRSLYRQVISLMPPNASKKMSSVMGDLLTAYSGMDWVGKSSLTGEGYFCLIIQPSAPLSNILDSVSDVYLQDTVVDFSSLIYVLSAMALQRLVDLSRLIKSIEYLIHRNDYLVHSGLTDDAGLSLYRKRSRNWKSCISDLRQEAESLTQFVMKYLCLLPKDHLCIPSFVDSKHKDKPSGALCEYAWDLSIGSMDEKSLPSAVWWIICQNVDIWCVHASKKDLKKFLSLLIRVSIPFISSVNDSKEDNDNKPTNQKKITVHEISLELFSDTILYEQQFFRRHMASTFCRTLEKSVSSIFNDVGEIDVKSTPDWEEVVRVLEHQSSVILGNKSVKKDHLPLDATAHLLNNLSAESCQKERLVPVANEFAICKSLLRFLSWMPKGRLSSKSFKLYATCILNLERLTVDSLLCSHNELCLPEQYELVQLFVSCRRTLKNLVAASSVVEMEGCRSSLFSLLTDTPAPILWILKSLSVVVELQHKISEDTATQVKDTLLPVMDQTSSLLFSLTRDQFECALHCLISDVDACGEKSTSVVGQKEVDGTNAWENVRILSEAIKEYMHNTRASVKDHIHDGKLSFLTSKQELKRLSAVVSSCQGFLWGLASALEKVDTKDSEFGKNTSGSKVDFIHHINLCIDTCADFVHYFVYVLFCEDDHLPHGLSNVHALEMSECNDHLIGTGETLENDYADVDKAIKKDAKGNPGSIDCFSQSSGSKMQSSKYDPAKDSYPENADFESLLIKIDHERQCLNKSVLLGLLRGDNFEAAVFLRQLLIASSAIIRLNLQLNRTSSSWSLIPVLVGISDTLLLEFVSKINIPESLSFVWLDGAVKFLEQLGTCFPLANSLLSRNLYAKLIDIHLRALGKCISLQGKRAALASQEIESSTKMLNGQRESSKHAISHKTYGLEEFKAMLRRSFIVFVKKPSELHLLSAIQAIERAVVGVQDGCTVNYQIHTGSSDGGKVSMIVAAGIDCLDLILEHVTGRRRLSLVKRHIQSLVASLFNVLLHLQGPNIFYQNVNPNNSHTDPDSGSVVLMCIDILTRVFGKHTLFQVDACHVAQSLRVPASMFHNVSQLQNAEAPDSSIASEISESEDLTSTNSSVVDRKFSVQLFAACCRLLCTVVKHHRSESQRCFALLEDSVSVLLHCLEMVNVDPASRKYSFSWEVQEGVKCACFLRRVYEEIRQQKDVYGQNCFQLLSNYIWVYCGFGPLKIGIRREIDEALRPGVYALIDACSTDDLQHLHTAFGEGPCRSTLANLQHDYKTNFQYEGKV